MKVTLLMDRAGVQTVFTAGAVIDYPEAVALRLIAEGQAAPVSDPPAYDAPFRKVGKVGKVSTATSRSAPETRG